jgi:hypothetical protein
MKNLLRETCLIKKEQVRYQDTPCSNEIKKQEHEDMMQVDHFSICVQRQNGTILGVQICHASGDKVSLDFSYI